MFSINNQIELWLQQHGVVFEFMADVEFADLQHTWDSKNIGRPSSTPVVVDAVDDYAEAAGKGSVFPGVIIAPTTDGYEVLDGVQRLAAARKRDLTRFGAYVLDDAISEEMRETIRVCANSILNGRRTSDEFCIERVVDKLVEKFRMSVSEASEWSGYSKDRIQQEVDTREGKRRLNGINVDVSLKPCNQKGFQLAWMRTFRLSDHKDATSQLRTLCKNLQLMKANNGESEKILENYTGIKKKSGVKLSTQIRSVTSKWSNEPYYRRRIEKNGHSRHPVDNLLTALRSANTKAKNCLPKKQDVISSDRNQSECLIDEVKELRARMKRIVPREYWECDSDVFV